MQPLERRLDTRRQTIIPLADLTKSITTRWRNISAGRRETARLLAGIGLLLAVWRFCILAYSLILARVGGGEPWPAEYAGMRLWRFSVRHDAEQYLRIAEQGYSQVAAEPSSVTFFPAFPLAISIADALLPGSDVLAALLIVHIALACGLAYVFRLARLDSDERAAWWAVGFLLMFPWAVYFSAVYPHSLLLLAVAGALYHARRGQWWRAGGFGVVAGATSLAGLTLIVPLTLELRQWAKTHALRPRGVIPVALAPLGGIAYFAYVISEFGSLSVYVDGLREQDKWMPSSVLFSGADYLREYRDPLLTITRPLLPAHEVYVGVELTLIGVFLAAGALLWWKGRRSYAALVVLMTLVPVLTGTRLGIGGHVAVLFPVFILAGRIRQEGVRMALSIILTLGLSLTVLLFVQGRWPG